MLESLLLSLIDRYLSRYLLEINAEQFSADLLSKREITIENLSLNCPNINADLPPSFPVEFVSIVIGRVQCSFFALRLEHLHVRLRPNLLSRGGEEGETKARRFLLSMVEKVQLEIVDLRVTYVNETPSFRLRFDVDRIEASEGVCRVTHPSLHLDDRTLLYPATTMEIRLQDNHAQSFVNRLELQLDLQQFLLLLQFFRSIPPRRSSSSLILRSPPSSSWYQTSSDWLKTQFVDWWTTSTSNEDLVFQFTVNIQTINLRIESLFPLDLFNVILTRDSIRVDGISLGDFLSSVKQDRPILELTFKDVVHLRSSSSQFQLSKDLPITSIVEFVRQIPKIEGEKTFNIDIELNEMKVNINNRDETISVGFSQMTLNNDMPGAREEEEFSTPRGSPVPMDGVDHPPIRFRLKDFQVECLRDERRRSLVDRCQLTADIQHPVTKMEILLPQLRIDLDRFHPRRNLLERLLPLLRLPPFPLEFHLDDLLLILPNRLHIHLRQLNVSSLAELSGTIESVLLSHSIDVVVRRLHFSTKNFFNCQLGFERVETLVSSKSEVSTNKRRCLEREILVEKTQMDVQWNANEIEVHLPSVKIRLNSNLLESLQLESFAGIDLQVQLENCFASFRSPSTIHFRCSALDLIDNKVRSLILALPSALPLNVLEVDLLQFSDLIINVRSLRFLLFRDWIERLSRPLKTPSSRSLNVEFNLHAVQFLVDLPSDALLVPLTMKMIYQGAIQCVLDDVGLYLCEMLRPDQSLRSLIDPPLRIELNLLDELEMKISPIHLDLSYSVIRRLLSLSRSIPAGQHRSSKGQFQCEEICVSISDDFLPLLKVDLRSLRLRLADSIEFRCGFDVFYLNRRLSGLEPLVEPCSMSLTIDRTPSSLLVSIHSTERLNVNLSESFFDLCRSVPREWSQDRRGDLLLVPVDCYSLWNLLGMELRFAYSLDDEGEWRVRDGERISFQPRGKNLFLSFGQWKCSSSISLDRQGHFFRQAQSTTGEEQLTIRIEIQRTKDARRLLTIRSSREIRNELNTPVDVRWNVEEERRLESGESFSLPIQSTKTFSEIEVRPSDFGLNYSSRLHSSLHSCSMPDDVQSLFFVHLHSRDEKHLSIQCPLIFVNLLPCSLTIETSSRPRISLEPNQSWFEHTWNVLQPMDICLSRDDYRMKNSVRLGECRDVSLFDPFEREVMMKIESISRREHQWKIFISSPFVVFNRTDQTFFINDEEHQLKQDPFLADSKKERIRLKLMDPQGQWSQPIPTQSIGIIQRQLTSKDKQRSTMDIVIDIREGRRRTKLIFVNNRYLISNHSSFDLSIVEKDSILSVPRQSTCPFHRSSSVQIQLLDSIYRSGSFSIDDEEQSFDVNIRVNESDFTILHIQAIEERGSLFLLIRDCDQHRSPPYRLRNRSDLPVEFYQSSVPHRRRILRARETIAYALDEPRGKPSISCRIDGGTSLTLDLRQGGEERSLFYPNWICLSLGEDLVIDYLEKRLIVAERDEQRTSQWWVINEEGLLIHCDSSPRLHWTGKTLSKQELTNAFVLSSSFDQLSIERFSPERRETQRWMFDDRGYLRLISSPMCLQVFGEFQATSDVILVFHP